MFVCIALQIVFVLRLCLILILNLLFLFCLYDFLPYQELAYPPVPPKAYVMRQNHSIVGLRKNFVEFEFFYSPNYDYRVQVAILFALFFLVLIYFISSSFLGQEVSNFYIIR